MTSNGDNVESDVIVDALQELGAIEKDFAAVELDARKSELQPFIYLAPFMNAASWQSLVVRQKEYSLKELYAKRQASIAKIPKFWPTVFTNGPDELQSAFAPTDAKLLEALKSMKIERYQIKSDTEGEPRSLRFTFEFDKNDLFQDTTVVKDFEFQVEEDGGSLISTPITFNWTAQSKRKGINKILDLAADLYKAEKAYTDGAIDAQERENLWQYEKLKEELDKQADLPATLGFLNWFGFRGINTVAVQENQDGDQDELNELVDIETFPEGDDIAMVLAEELWPNVMDYFVRAQEEDRDDDDEMVELEEDEDDAPELVEADQPEEAGEEDDEEKPPAKKPKLS